MKIFDLYSENLGKTILRFGIAFVFIWFGVSQLQNQSMWTSYIPENVLSILNTSAVNMVLFNGSMEVVLGLCLFVGFYSRVSALILGIHIASITFIIGFNPTGIRDFGITVGTLASFLIGPGKFSLDYFLNKNKSQQDPV